MLGAIKCKTRSDVAECTDMVETGLGERCDERVKGEPAVEHEPENLDLVGNLDQGTDDVDSGSIRSVCVCCVMPKIIASDLSGLSARPL